MPVHCHGCKSWLRTRFLLAHRGVGTGGERRGRDEDRKSYWKVCLKEIDREMFRSTRKRIRIDRRLYFFVSFRGVHFFWCGASFKRDACFLRKILGEYILHSRYEYKEEINVFVLMHNSIVEIILQSSAESIWDLQ